jgi:hypothetical protein
MKKALIILFILFSPATGAALSNADQATIPQSHELSRDRHAQHDGLKHGHSHDVKPKSKYDLRNLDANRGADAHKDVHKHGDKHDHKAKSKYDLRDTDRHDHGKAHSQEHGHGDAHLHDRGNGHGSHDDHGDNPGHEGHEHHKGFGGGHDHGYDRLWQVGCSC